MTAVKLISLISLLLLVLPFAWGHLDLQRIARLSLNNVLYNAVADLKNEGDFQTCIGRESFRFGRPPVYQNITVPSLWFSGFDDFKIDSIKYHGSKVKVSYHFPLIIGNVCAFMGDQAIYKFRFDFPNHYVMFEFNASASDIDFGLSFKISNFRFIPYHKSMDRRQNMVLFGVTVLPNLLWKIRFCSYKFADFMYNFAHCRLHTNECEKLMSFPIQFPPRCEKVKARDSPRKA